MLESVITAEPVENVGVFSFDVSDEALEAAAGDARGLFCSCSGCNSACSNGSR